MLSGKTILVISPQPWGRMFVSKHHYAAELARRGNRVLFLEPPRRTGPAAPELRRADGHPSVELLSRRTVIPDVLRFKLRPLYERLVALELLHLRRSLDVRFDVVWCFDPNLYPDLRAFGAAHAIYHPVDMISAPFQLRVGASADLVLSVADNILDKLGPISSRRHFLHHGLGPDFVAAAHAVGAPWRRQEGAPRVGYVGNLFIDQLDRETFQTVVRENPEVEIHVWGPTAPNHSNLGAQRTALAEEFVRFLRSAKNVRLRGVLPPAQLATHLHEMDAFLLCYDPGRDPASGANSHKILEYLSTGRVIVANHVSTYAKLGAELLRMPATPNNALLPRLFTETMHALEEHNALALHEDRVRFALAQTYERHVSEVERLLEPVGRSGVAGQREVA